MDERQLLIEQQKQAERAELEKEILIKEYDNEWINFVKELAKNQSTKDIANFIDSVFWTDRQKNTIKHYAKIVLGDGLSTTFITSHTDYLKLYDDKALIDCDLTLGMTTYDITPEFNILIGLINMHFGIESRKSKGGFFTKRIGTQRHEIEHEEHIRDKNMGFKDKITNAVGWDK